MTPTWHDPSLPIEERVESLLAAMTVEVKFGQLGSAWPKPEKDSAENDGGTVAPLEGVMRAGAKALDEAAAHGLGHYTRAFGTVPVTAVEGAALLEEFQRNLVERTRLGIPAIAHEECLTGFTTLGATVYPTSLAWAAIFAPELIEHMAGRIGADMRAVGVHQGLSSSAMPASNSKRERRNVTFRLHADRTSFTGRDGKRIVEPGAFTVGVGHSSGDLPLTVRFRIAAACASSTANASWPPPRPSPRRTRPRLAGTDRGRPRTTASAVGTRR